MARWILIVLLGLNAGHFLWARGDLTLLGWRPAALDEREPQRVAQQIRPAALQLRRGEPTAAPSAAAVPPPATPGAVPETTTPTTTTTAPDSDSDAPR